MVNYSQKLKRLNERALEIVETGQVFWIAPQTKSILLIDLHTEFCLHWLTCTSSLSQSLNRLIRWCSVDKNNGPAIGLVISRIESAMQALQAPSIDRFLKLTLIIAESVMTIVGAEYIKAIVEAKTLWDKIRYIYELGKPDLTPLSKMLPKLELAMEQMMLAALYFEMYVDCITKQASSPSHIVSIVNLKAPIIDHLHKLRAGVAAAADYTPTRFRGPEEGFWPPGLRGNVPDFNWKQPLG